MCDGGSHGGQPDPGSMCSRMSRVEQGVTDAKTPLPHPSFHVILSSFISVHHKSISTGAPKTPPKTRPARILGSGPKLVHHRQAQKHAGAHWIPNKQSARQDPIGSAGTARHGGKTAPGPLGRQNQPQKSPVAPPPTLRSSRRRRQRAPI
jgi:hypothetical protein